jgi:xylulokinase
MTSTRDVVLGVDVGTSSTKGVLVTTDGRILARTERRHVVDNPRPGWFEADPVTWWDEFVSIARELTAHHPDRPVAAVGVSGMGPCVLLADERDRPVRPAILYGIDMRAGRQIERLDAELGSDEILRRCGSALSSQAAGTKIAWVADEEPAAFAGAKRLFMPSSWLVRRLTGGYVLDHHSASQCTPLYDVHRLDWYRPWVERICPGLELPPLLWSGDRAGEVTAEAAELTGIPAGTPVATGTVDAWAEAVSAGAHEVGDLMLMYGTTMFLVHTVDKPLTQPSLWGTVGALPGTRTLAGGLATSGSITAWVRDLTGSDFATLVGEAADSPPGANNLLVLPYFSGERTPIMDPRARGVVAGLTLAHTRGDLYRAVLEGVGFAVRHNLETFAEAGGNIRRVVAVGGGAQGALWTQIVSDITGRPQVIPTHTIGASLGMAFLAAGLVAEPVLGQWNPPAEVREPDVAVRDLYDDLYAAYRRLYPDTAEVVHGLARRQEEAP